EGCFAGSQQRPGVLVAAAPARVAEALVGVEEAVHGRVDGYAHRRLAIGPREVRREEGVPPGRRRGGARLAAEPCELSPHRADVVRGVAGRTAFEVEQPEPGGVEDDVVAVAVAVELPRPGLWQRAGACSERAAERRE